MLRQEVRASKATLLVLDGLVAAEKAASSDMEFKKFIHELQTLATVADCAMFLLTSGGDDPEVAVAEHTMVDCVIEMRSRLHGWRAERDLEILKRRGDSFLRGRHAFRISDDGITIFPRFEAVLASPTSARTHTAGRENLHRPGSAGQHARWRCAPAVRDLATGAIRQRKDDSRAALSQPMHARKSGCSSSASTKLARASLPKPEPWDCHSQPHLDAGHVEFLWQPTTEALLDETCAQLLSAIRARGARRLFLDGLGGIVKLADSPRACRSYSDRFGQ